MEKEEGELSPASKVSGKELKWKQIVSPPEQLRHLLHHHCWLPQHRRAWKSGEAHGHLKAPTQHRVL